KRMNYKTDIHYLFEETLKEKGHDYHPAKLTKRLFYQLKKDYVVVSVETFYFDCPNTDDYVLANYGFSEISTEKWLKLMQKHSETELYRLGSWEWGQEDAERFSKKFMEEVYSSPISQKGRIYLAKYENGDYISIFWFGRDYCGRDYEWIFRTKKSVCREFEEEQTFQYLQRMESEEVTRKFREKYAGMTPLDLISEQFQQYQKFNSQKELFDFVDEYETSHKKNLQWDKIYFFMRINGRIEPILFDYTMAVPRREREKGVHIPNYCYFETEYRKFHNRDPLDEWYTIEEIIDITMELSLFVLTPKKPSLPEQTELLAIMEEEEAGIWMKKVSLLCEDYSFEKMHEIFCTNPKEYETHNYGYAYDYLFKIYDVPEEYDYDDESEEND
ncbi:MAG TPA: hypothetical protein DCO72_05840, partial [Ruminococcus sp.]|nr:hypothetical protein [Ruminococcus sp.]